MDFEVGKVYNGFKLIEKRNIEEINSLALLFFHEKSGARLYKLINDDDNKVFSIGFRTPPYDDTGLPHILEHSVLCGSRKFPSKEPFVELLKGSLNTFLNAFTFSDKTMYPFASRNEKDFFNLMDVYMDAVLYPNIYKYPEILMQEGWHYELNDKNEEMIYKGVVYNEMQGAFSSAESLLIRRIQQNLFPDSPYGNESGGDPDFIPNLTQEKFIEYHKKYYHPSNSYIYLYGNGDTLKELEFLNENYLKDFDIIEIDSSIKEQKPFDSMKDMVLEYPITPNEDEKDKTFLSLSFVTGKSTDAESHLALNILEHLLLETSAAPLKRALIEEGIGKDVFGQYDSSIMQPVFSIIVKNSNIEMKNKFKDVVFKTLSKLVQEGIDKKLIEASINKKEFEMREAEEEGMPKGLLYDIKLMESWLYDENPALHLQYGKIIEKLKENIKTNYFEKLIEKYLLNNTHSLILALVPKKGLAEKKVEEIKRKLADIKNNMSEEEIEIVIQQTKSLKKRQEEPDSKENLEKLPLLSIKDINTKAEIIPIEEKSIEGVKVLFHPIFTNKIFYINFLFNTSAVPYDVLPYISLLSDVLGKMSTEKYSYSELAKEININTGGIRFGVDAYQEKESLDKFYPQLIVKSKALSDKIPKLVEFVGEIAGKTDFNDKKRLKEIIQEIKSRSEMRIFDGGHIIASMRVMSYFSKVGAYLEKLSGLSYYKFIVDIEKNFDSMSDVIISNLKKASDIIFNKGNLIISVTCEEKDYSIFKENIGKILNYIGNKEFKPVEYEFELEPKNEGLLTPGNVQYVAKGYNFIKEGYRYTGRMQVLRTILSGDYLWNRVRVQGGAYGGFMRFDRSGNFVFVSYRDPNLKETLNVYNSSFQYLNNFDADKREMTKYIIGTIGRLDYPLTPSGKAERADINYITHLTYEDLQKERNEVLDTTVADIKSFDRLVHDVMKHEYICVLGSETKIKENKDIFNNIINVFE
ncbi:insulinase family protein [Caloramator sp. E03]|uniref:insulinase family protein n=1 Tax=Caloramator sp. E03 TaxID=2576307 RepID=UPI0011107CA2|nr:insulinase family protein [Caloramator sp. E03]QCX32815.1 insulinase family protein [Caloramator sp. E03]